MQSTSLKDAYLRRSGGVTQPCMIKPFVQSERRSNCLQAQNGASAYKIDFYIMHKEDTDEHKLALAPSYGDCVDAFTQTLTGNNGCGGPQDERYGGHWYSQDRIFEYS